MPKVPTDRQPGKKNPVIRTAYIVNDHEYAEQVDEAAFSEGILMLQVGGEPHNEELRAAYEKQKAVVAEMRKTLRDEYSLRYKFRAIGRKALDELIDAYPMTEEVQKEMIARLQRETPGQPVNVENFPPYNPFTFAPALCAASLIEPIGISDQIKGYWDDPDWNSAELGALFQAALEANTTRRVVKAGNG